MLITDACSRSGMQHFGCKQDADPHSADYNTVRATTAQPVHLCTTTCSFFHTLFRFAGSTRENVSTFEYLL